MYVHVPFCKTRCHYCAFVTGPFDPDLEDPFAESVVGEIEMWGRGKGRSLWQPISPVDTIYFGGGTPSLLKAATIGRIIEACDNNFAIPHDPEITIEANPGFAKIHTLTELRSAGVNRVSLGIQSLDDFDLKRMGRSHSSCDALSTLRDLREVGFSNISVDLLAGFPGQTLESFERTLHLVLECEPEHLSVYLFERKDGTVIDSRLQTGKESPLDEDLAADMYELTCGLVCSAGYKQYEISNFSKDGLQCRHNLKYWQDEIYVGIGPGAHGMTGQHRYENVHEFVDYRALVAKGELPTASLTRLDPMTRFTDALIMGSRLTQGIDLAHLGQRYSLDAVAFVTRTAGDLEKAGLFIVKGKRLQLTPRGRLLSNILFSRWV